VPCLRSWDCVTSSPKESGGLKRIEPDTEYSTSLMKTSQREVCSHRIVGGGWAELRYWTLTMPITGVIM
jgi:hypothetical protein